MDHMDHMHGGHEASSAGGAASAAMPTCKISMLWNWTTIDVCFISSQWHIRTIGGYVGTVIGIFLITIALEALRRISREYDRKILREFVAKHQTSDSAAAKETDSNKSGMFGRPQPTFQPTLAQQAIRSSFYFVQFSAGYMLMLSAMYFNGGLILAIFFGAFVGHFVAARDTAGDVLTAENREQCCC